MQRVAYQHGCAVLIRNIGDVSVEVFARVAIVSLHQVSYRVCVRVQNIHVDDLPRQRALKPELQCPALLRSLLGGLTHARHSSLPQRRDVRYADAVLVTCVAGRTHAMYLLHINVVGKLGLTACT